MVEQFLDWLAQYGTGTVAVLIMFANAFGESIILPVPCDAVLMALSALAPKNAIYYAAITVVGSVLGAMLGYLIGLKGGRKILVRLFNEKNIKKLEEYFERYGVWAIFVAGFTPIPYKVFTIASGVARYNFVTFIIISLISRGLRFFAIGVLFYIYGEQMLTWFKDNLGTVSLWALVIIIVIFIVYLIFKRNNNKKKS